VNLIDVQERAPAYQIEFDHRPIPYTAAAPGSTSSVF